MSGFKGTPGPWEVMNDDGELKVVQTGSIEHGDGWKSYCDICSEVSMTQNARLIAAAPELLEALQEIVEMNAQYCHDKYGDSRKAETMACVRVARAAIAKALGQ